MKLLKIVFIVVVIWQGLCDVCDARETAQLGNAQEFSFKFQPEQPMLGYDVILIPVKKISKDVTTIRLEPSNVRGDWDITGPGGHITMKLRGSELTKTQDGVVVVDTKKNIGLAEARELKQEIAALYLTGEMDIDSKGKVVDIRGDVPFVEFWRENIETQIGFFGIVFPDNPIPTKGTWKEVLTLKKMGDVLLEDPGMRFTVTFTRQPDTIIEDRKIKVFTIEAPFKEKDLIGYMDQGGQRVRLNISNLDRRASGTIRFDAEKGVLIDGDIKALAKTSMNSIAEGQAFSIDMKIDLMTDTRLLPTPEQ